MFIMVLCQLLIPLAVPDGQQSIIPHIPEGTKRPSQVIRGTAGIEPSFVIHPRLVPEEWTQRMWMELFPMSRVQGIEVGEHDFSTVFHSSFLSNIMTILHDPVPSLDRFRGPSQTFVLYLWEMDPEVMSLHPIDPVVYRELHDPGNLLQVPLYERQLERYATMITPVIRESIPHFNEILKISQSFFKG